MVHFWSDKQNCKYANLWGLRVPGRAPAWTLSCQSRRNTWSSTRWTPLTPPTPPRATPRPQSKPGWCRRARTAAAAAAQRRGGESRGGLIVSPPATGLVLLLLLLLPTNLYFTSTHKHFCHRQQASQISVRIYFSCFYWGPVCLFALVVCKLGRFCGGSSRVAAGDLSKAGVGLPLTLPCHGARVESWQTLLNAAVQRYATLTIPLISWGNSREIYCLGRENA